MGDQLVNVFKFWPQAEYTDTFSQDNIMAYIN